MKIIHSDQFDSYWMNETRQADDSQTETVVKEIIEAVRADGDMAVRQYTQRFDKIALERFEIPLAAISQAAARLRASEAELAGAIELAAEHIKQFSQRQRAQFADFECEIAEGLITGQRVIPVEKAAIYVPAGRFPLFSSVLMGIIPALCAGVEELVLASPPQKDGLPDGNILAAAGIAAEVCGLASSNSRLRIFALGGAQAIAALALGTGTIPRVDLIAGPGNKYVAAAKRILFGEVGIDFIAGPTDVLIIAGASPESNDPADAARFIAADLIAQAEHDPDARARCLVPGMEFARRIGAEADAQLASLPTAATASASLDAGGLIVVYQDREEAIRIANTIAPEHLELQLAGADSDAEAWIPRLKNYGSLFIGALSAEVLGDYSAGINHTLPTSGSARFTGGLSVRHFLKTPTTLRCSTGEGHKKALRAAELIAAAEGLSGHARSAALRLLIYPCFPV